MKVYQCWVSGDELFSDARPKNVQRLDDIGFYKVKGEFKTRKEEDIVLAGANASQEEAAEETEGATSVSGYDIEIDYDYHDDGVSYSKMKKFADMVFKDYLANLKEHIEKELEGAEREKKLEEFAEAKKLLQAFIKNPPCKSLEDISILSAKNFSADGMYIMKTWETEEQDDGTQADVPYYWYLIIGVEEIKC